VGVFAIARDDSTRRKELLALRNSIALDELVATIL
jgi:hypothetical protein